jgi:hypothetical protein
MQYKIKLTFASLLLATSLNSCSKSIDQQIAHCQCEKFEALAKKIEANPQEAEKSLAYMGEILDCINPHFQKMQAMDEAALQQLQKNIDLHVSKTCAAAHNKLKNK